MQDLDALVHVGTDQVTWKGFTTTHGYPILNANGKRLLQLDKATDCVS